MNAQFLKTETGEELVVLTRCEYDSLLAPLGDEEAEDRMTMRIMDEVGERIASGEEKLVPLADVYPAATKRTRTGAFAKVHFFILERSLTPFCACISLTCLVA